MGLSWQVVQSSPDTRWEPEPAPSLSEAQRRLPLPEGVSPTGSLSGKRDGEEDRVVARALQS